jgi:hypothetical protein
MYYKLRRGPRASGSDAVALAAAFVGNAVPSSSNVEGPRRTDLSLFPFL